MNLLNPKLVYRRNHIYIIQRKQAFDVAGIWYFKDLGDEIISQDTHPIIWTPTMKFAFEFVTEEAVEEFKNDFLYDRNVEIIRIKRK